MRLIFACGWHNGAQQDSVHTQSNLFRVMNRLIVYFAALMPSFTVLIILSYVCVCTEIIQLAGKLRLGCIQ